MLKKTLRALFFVGLLACIFGAAALTNVTPVLASYCVPVCSPPGPCPVAGQTPVTWVGPGCTGSEPRCNDVCIGP